MLTPGTDEKQPRKSRPKIAFFGYPDIFEDFYPHYGVDQQSFARDWACTGNHAFVAVLQASIGDVIWYEHSLKPTVPESTHRVTGNRVCILPSSLPHQCLWRLFYLPRCAWRWRGLYRGYATLASYLAPLSLPTLRAILRQRPDYIFTQDYCSGRFDVLLLIAKWLQIPLFAYHAGSTPERYLGSWLRRVTLPRSNKILASNRNEASMLATRYRLTADQLEVILTPINTELLRPIEREAACATLNLPPQRRYLLYIGRLLDPIKRVSSLIREFSKLIDQYEDVDLLIAGTGPDEAALKQQAGNTPAGRIRFWGWINDEPEKCALYNSAECLILPSLREGFPTVVGESLACGTPVLGTKLDGIVELIRPGLNGWLIDKGDDIALRQTIESVLQTPEQTRSLRQAARNTAEARLSPDAIADQLRHCFSNSNKLPQENSPLI